MRRAKVSLFSFRQYSAAAAAQGDASLPQVSVHTADVKQVFKAYSIEISASSADDLEEVGLISHLPFCTRLLTVNCLRQ
jgi:hypothetical protein